MKDYFYDIRKYWYGKLNVISAPIYDRIVPKNVNYPHVIMDRQDALDNSTLDKFGVDTFIDFEIVDRQGEGVSSKVVDDIAQEILELIDDTSDVNARWRLVYSYLDSDFTDTFQDSSGAVLVTRRIRIGMNLIEI